MRELALSYGVYADYQETRNSIDQFIHIALRSLTSSYGLKGEDLVVVLAGNFFGKEGFSFIEVGTIQYLTDFVNITKEA
ncbi:MAG: hypothetical protein GX999_05460 [Bacteroidales bacterium]|jgi:pyruvate kinase|nr:hypothetical protein [Bacteroidales bacterium]